MYHFLINKLQFLTKSQLITNRFNKAYSIQIFIAMLLWKGDLTLFKWFSNELFPCTNILYKEIRIPSKCILNTLIMLQSRKASS